jgi:hypothetical protein
MANECTHRRANVPKALVIERTAYELFEIVTPLHAVTK